MSNTASSHSTTPIRIALVEDQPLFREMLQTTFHAVPSIQVVMAVGTVSEARARITPGSVDVAVLDIELPDGNGIALGVSLRRRDPRLAILLLSAHNAMDLLLDLPDDVKSRWSYLSKSSTTSTQTMLTTIIKTAAGQTVLDPMLLKNAAPRAGTAAAALTARQFDVLRLIAEGLSNSGIGQRLGIAEKSVQNHINAIYSTLKIDDDPAQNPRVTATLRLLEESGSLDF